MGLPKNNLPVYPLTMPSDGKKITYRPFDVKEEKNLMIALQEADPEAILMAIKNVLSACTFDKLEISKLSQVDIEWLFINIRNKSMGEGVEVESECSSCGKKNNLLINLSEVVVKKDKEVSPEIDLENGLWLVMEYPSVDMSYMLTGDETEDEDDQIKKTVASCIVKIVEGENVFTVKEHPFQEAVDFVESLTELQMIKINDFFESMPRISYEKKYKCHHCEAEQNVILEGLQNFFG